MWAFLLAASWSLPDGGGPGEGFHVGLPPGGFLGPLLGLFFSLPPGFISPPGGKDSESPPPSFLSPPLGLLLSLLPGGFGGLPGELSSPLPSLLHLPLDGLSDLPSPLFGELLSQSGGGFSSPPLPFFFGLLLGGQLGGLPRSFGNPLSKFSSLPLSLFGSLPGDFGKLCVLSLLLFFLLPPGLFFSFLLSFFFFLPLGFFFSLPLGLFISLELSKLFSLPLGFLLGKLLSLFSFLPLFLFFGLPFFFRGLLGFFFSLLPLFLELLGFLSGLLFVFLLDLRGLISGLLGSLIIDGSISADLFLDLEDLPNLLLDGWTCVLGWCGLAGEFDVHVLVDAQAWIRAQLTVVGLHVALAAGAHALEHGGHVEPADAGWHLVLPWAGFLVLATIVGGDDLDIAGWAGQLEGGLLAAHGLLHDLATPVGDFQVLCDALAWVDTKSVVVDGQGALGALAVLLGDIADIGPAGLSGHA